MVPIPAPSFSQAQQVTPCFLEGGLLFTAYFQCVFDSIVADIVQRNIPSKTELRLEDWGGTDPTPLLYILSLLFLEGYCCMVENNVVKMSETVGWGLGLFSDSLSTTQNIPDTFPFGKGYGDPVNCGCLCSCPSCHFHLHIYAVQPGNNCLQINILPETVEC